MVGSLQVLENTVQIRMHFFNEPDKNEANDI